MNGGDLLAEILVPGIRAADMVLVVSPPTLVLLLPVLFELGVAIGLEKPIGIGISSGQMLGTLAHLVRSAFPDSSPKSTPLPRIRELLLNSEFWNQVPLTTKSGKCEPLALCPQGGMGHALREVITELRPDWSKPEPVEAHEDVFRQAPEELAPGHSADRIVFSQCGTEVDAIDLPDGFRSTVAWLADLCAAWHRTAPLGDRHPGARPADLRLLHRSDL